MTRWLLLLLLSEFGALFKLLGSALRWPLDAELASSMDKEKMTVTQ
jgi:hypothetical protein